MKRVAARSQALGKVYGRRDTAVHALRDVTVRFPSVEFAAVMGPSGSGKSTLLHCLAALEAPSTGRVFLGDTDITDLGQRERAWLRRDRIGFVFQAYNLVPTLDAHENITLPQRLAGRSLDRRWLRTVVDQVGLRDRLHHRPAELSGGQQQRVAIARALAGRPEIIFADEPTGNLDTRSGHEVLSLLRAAVDDHGQTIVMVTHDPMAAAYADRVVFLGDGCLVDELRDPTAELVLERLKSMGGFLPGADDHPPAPVRPRRRADPPEPDEEQTSFLSTGRLRTLLGRRKDVPSGNGRSGGRRASKRQPPREWDRDVRDDAVEERLLEQVHELWDHPDERVLGFVHAAFHPDDDGWLGTTRSTPEPNAASSGTAIPRRSPQADDDPVVARRSPQADAAVRAGRAVARRSPQAEDAGRYGAASSRRSPQAPDNGPSTPRPEWAGPPADVSAAPRPGLTGPPADASTAPRPGLTGPPADVSAAPRPGLTGPPANDPAEARPDWASPPVDGPVGQDEPRLVRRRPPSAREGGGRPTWRRNPEAQRALPPRTEARQPATPEVVPAPPLSVRSFRAAPATRGENGRRGEETTVWRGPIPPPTLEPSAWRRRPEEPPQPQEPAANGNGASIARLPGRQARRDRPTPLSEDPAVRARERWSVPPPPPRPAPQDEEFLPPMAGRSEPEAASNGVKRDPQQTAAQLLEDLLARIQSEPKPARRAQGEGEFLPPAHGGQHDAPDLPWPAQRRAGATTERTTRPHDER